MITFVKILSFLFLVLNLNLGCSKNQSSNSAQQSAPKPEVIFSEVSANNCLNVEKIITQLRNPLFKFPASIMTTNLKPITGISLQKLKYLSYTNFYYKTGIPYDLNILNAVAQQDCNLIQLQTSSHEILNFKITEHSSTHIKFELTEIFRDGMSNTNKKALFERIQPYSYTITYLSENSLKIVEKFSTLDPLCLTQNILRLEVTKIVNWSHFSSELPQSYDINSTYLETVKSTLINSPIMVVDPIIDSDNSISVENIKKIMHEQIQDELKLCL